MCIKSTVKLEIVYVTNGIKLQYIYLMRPEDGVQWEGFVFKVQNGAVVYAYYSLKKRL